VRPHRKRWIFHWENLMQHLLTGHSECRSIACGEIPTLGPLGMVLGSVLENPDVTPEECPFPWRDLDPV